MNLWKKGLRIMAYLKPELPGYDLPVIKAMADACSAEIVASGGAGKLEHFYEAVEAGANILLAASVFHFHIIDIPELKEYLKSRGLNVT